MVVLVAAAAALAAGCATARVVSGWASSPVVANGSTDDWAGKQVCSTMKDGLQLSVANDAERLYVIAKFRANDSQWSRAAGMGGLTLGVTGPGKRKMRFRLPKGPEMGDLGLGARDSGFAVMPRPMNRMRSEFEGRLIVTDVDKLDAPVLPDGSQGPAAGFSSENGMCVYEYSIPLNDSATGHYSLGAGAGTGLNLTVTAGPSAAQREAMRGEMQRGGGPPQGGGGPGGGGMPGGRGGSGNGGPGRGGPQGGPLGVQEGTANPSVGVAVRLAVEP
jgi:hypothetical protein